MSKINSLIKANGAITIADFMQEAMFNEKTGYYRTKEPIGARADFITAPEISSVFGELIAAYFLSFILKSDKEISFVEMGAGLGTLYSDALSTFAKIATKLEKLDEIKRRINFNIVEISEKLTKVQQEKLAQSGFKINWFNNFEDFIATNQNRQIYFLANELFDCFQIHQFARTNNKWQEVLVGLKNKELCLTLENFSQEKHVLINKIALENNISQNQEDIIFEHSFAALNFMEKLSKTLKSQGGIALIIDYGYENPPLKSTLQALKNHQGKNILEDVGNCDLTALVNFKALQKTAQKYNLQTSLVSQKEFLTSLGIQERQGSNTNPNVNSAINRLIGEDQMGELFKCLILWENEL